MDCDPLKLDHNTFMALVDASRAVVSELTPEQVFKRVAEHAAAVLGAEGSAVLLYEATSHQLRFQVVTGPATALLTGERISADLGIAGRALKTGRAMRVDDVRLN